MKSLSPKPSSKFSLILAFSTAAVCAALLVPARAIAQTDVAVARKRHYAARGQWLLSAEAFTTPMAVYGGNTGDVSLTWSSQDNTATVFNLNLRPVVGYFFTDLVYGRLGFDIGYNHDSGLDKTSVGIEPGVGVALAVAPRWTFAPWVGLNLLYEHASQSSQTGDYVRLDLEVHAPFVFEIVEHVGLTAGVYYAQGLVNHANVSGTGQTLSKSGTIGLTTGLLGWW